MVDSKSDKGLNDTSDKLVKAEPLSSKDTSSDLVDGQNKISSSVAEPGILTYKTSNEPMSSGGLCSMNVVDPTNDPARVSVVARIASNEKISSNNGPPPHKRIKLETTDKPKTLGAVDRTGGSSVISDNANDTKKAQSDSIATPEPLTPRLVEANKQHLVKKENAGVSATFTSENSTKPNDIVTSPSVQNTLKDSLTPAASQLQPVNPVETTSMEKQPVAEQTGHTEKAVEVPNQQVSATLAVTASAPAPASTTISGAPMPQQQSSCTETNKPENSNVPKAVTVAPTAVVSSPPPQPPPSPPPPLKSITMSHLRKKYTAELQYMLDEFRKLERQLLGAKGHGSGVSETTGSRERREKLHSFIIHLEDTIRQIDLGCKLEAEGKSTVMVATSVPGAKQATEEEVKKQLATSAALTKLTKEKEEEENVQKLEEHILANLLPVKDRLKKQLAAQQGATKNPAGMPKSHRGLVPSAAAEQGKGTFAAAAEEKRKQEAARVAALQQQQQAARPSIAGPSQFGKPLGGGGSSLTQKLHGSTLGSSNRPHGSGVGNHASAGTSNVSTDDGAGAKKRKILYAGVAHRSEQIQSSAAAAAGVHKELITPVKPNDQSIARASQVPDKSLSSSTTTAQPPNSKLPQHAHVASAATAPAATGSAYHQKASMAVKAKPAIAQTSAIEVKPLHQTINLLPEDERRKLRRKKRRKRKRRDARRLEKQRQMSHTHHSHNFSSKSSNIPIQVKKSSKMAGKSNGKKKGPNTVEYICALCNETYGSTCDYNPWWALQSHECPKCRKNQIPRLDISAPANAIEYHPALLAHAEEANGNSGGGATSSAGGSIHVSHMVPAYPTSQTIGGASLSKYASDSDSMSDFSDDSDEGNLSDGSLGSDDTDGDTTTSLTPAEQAENEPFGAEYTGPTFSDIDSARLLVLISHASTCPGRHKSKKHRDVCLSMKYLMLHARDCPGTTSSLDVCPFPWCRKIKHLLYHLVSCQKPRQCMICSPANLSDNLSKLTGLNGHRQKKYIDRMKASIKAAASAARCRPCRPAPSAATTLNSKTPVAPPVANRVVSQYKPTSNTPCGTATLNKTAVAGKPSGTATALSYVGSTGVATTKNMQVTGGAASVSTTVTTKRVVVQASTIPKVTRTQPATVTSSTAAAVPANNPPITKAQPTPIPSVANPIAVVSSPAVPSAAPNAVSQVAKVTVPSVANPVATNASVPPTTNVTVNIPAATKQTVPSGANLVATSSSATASAVVPVAKTVTSTVTSQVTNPVANPVAVKPFVPSATPSATKAVTPALITTASTTVVPIKTSAPIPASTSVATTNASQTKIVEVKSTVAVPAPTTAANVKVAATAQQLRPVPLAKANTTVAKTPVVLPSATKKLEPPKPVAATTPLASTTTPSPAPSSSTTTVTTTTTSPTRVDSNESLPKLPKEATTTSSSTTNIKVESATVADEIEMTTTTDATTTTTTGSATLSTTTNVKVESPSTTDGKANLIEDFHSGQSEASHASHDTTEGDHNLVHHNRDEGITTATTTDGTTAT